MAEYGCGHGHGGMWLWPWQDEVVGVGWREMVVVMAKVEGGCGGCGGMWL